LNQPSRKARAGATTRRIRSNPAPPTSAEGDPSAPPDPGARASPAAPPAPPTPALPPLTDPAGVHRWLETSRAALLDLLAAAREGARRPRKRVLSRAEIRRQARDAFAQATSLLDLAAEALTRPA
jgi:hypothetical protein